MKTLLLLGGMTPDVTVVYYQIINRVVRSIRGGRTSASLYMYSANVDAMLQHASAGNWDKFAGVYTDPIAALTADGHAPRIDGVVVCAILAHKVTRQLEAALAPSGVPLLHIADFFAAHLRERYPHVKTLGLLGPKVTTLGADDSEFFIGRLQNAENGFKVIVPDSMESIDECNRGMMEEVAKGASSVTPATKAMFVKETRALIERGAEAVVLGSTDLGFVVRQEDVGGDIPIIEPAAVHAEMAAKWACEE